MQISGSQMDLHVHLVETVMTTMTTNLMQQKCVAIFFMCLKITFYNPDVGQVNII